MKNLPQDRNKKRKKEKLRDLLSSDMISPPLGDFRHTIHIGSGGGADDLFGDLSPLLKNALSLPIIGGVQALTLPAPTAPLTSAVTEVPKALSTTQSPPTSPSLAPPPKPPRLHLEERSPYLSNAGSMLSLHLDLGPSILEDVLQIMDNQRTGTFSGKGLCYLGNPHVTHPAWVNNALCFLFTD
uniref:CDC42 effector protein (Rho GTPase binding) 2 n=1 Tax=Cyprinus carpio TaxID=7962 RepID=A0A8C2E092_CYPCA